MKKITLKLALVSGVVLSSLMSVDTIQAQSFKDVTPKTSIYYNEIEEFSELGIINGYGNGVFAPKESMKRSHASKVVVETLEKAGVSLKDPSTSIQFKDVSKESLYYNYISKMKANGIVDGYEDGTFRPDDNVTKAQLLKILVEAFKIPITNHKEHRYSDLDKNAWSYKYINSAYNAGLITMGYDDKFKPNQKATREDLVVFTYRALKWQETKDKPLEETIFKKLKSNYKEETTKAPNSYKMFIKGIEDRKEYIPYDVSEFKSREEAVKFVLETIEWDIETNYPIKQFTVYHNGTIKMEYDFTEEEMQKMKASIENKSKEILKKIIKPTYNDYDKVKVVHDYLVLNVEYDESFYNSISKNPESWTVYGALVNGVAVCDGYARAMMYMLNQLGIENYYTTGDILETGELHAWNIVRIDGELYHVDATWNDPLYTGKDFIRYNYFLVNENTLKNERTWNTSLPRATDSRFLIK